MFQRRIFEMQTAQSPIVRVLLESDGPSSAHTDRGYAASHLRRVLADHQDEAISLQDLPGQPIAHALRPCVDRTRVERTVPRQGLSLERCPIRQAGPGGPRGSIDAQRRAATDPRHPAGNKKRKARCISNTGGPVAWAPSTSGRTRSSPSAASTGERKTCGR